MLLGILAALAVTCGAADAPAIGEFVRSESGFDGAVEVAETVADGEFDYVTVNIPYRDVHGQAKMGQGRLVVRRADLAPGKLLPAFCHVHYELGVDGAKKRCEQGWAVATAHYGDPQKGEYALELAPGDSYNLAVALVEWVRRLPFVDRSQLQIEGGSAGGYMALAMAGHFFPIAAVYADVPVVNWPFNLNYLEVNKPATQYGRTSPQETTTPFISAVTMLSDWAYGVFGKDLAAETYYLLSPISYVDRITCPALIKTATGDMLVPAEQFLSEHLYPIDPSAFPEGFVRDFEKLAPTEQSRRRLVEILGDKIEVFVQERPEDVPEFTLASAQGKEKEPKSPKTKVELPWSKDRPWSLAVLNEGAPLPHSPHSRYKWNTSTHDFVQAHRNRPPAPEILTPAKLDWLLQRYEGQIAAPLKLADGSPCNRLNFDRLEKLDAITGLLDYAALGPDHEARLKSLYGAGVRKPFGDALDLEQLRKERAGLVP